jgi:hypothetical protein
VTESSPQTRRSVAALPQSRLCVWTAARPLRTRTPRHAALPCVLHYLHVQAISYHLSGGRSVMFALARSVGEWKLLQWAKVEQLFGPAVAEPPTAEAPTTPRRFARASWRVCDGVSFEVRTPPRLLHGQTPTTLHLFASASTVACTCVQCIDTCHARARTCMRI